MKVAWLVAVSVLAVFVFSACGSSRRRHYSVRQVEAAFASQGVQLHRVVGQQAPHFVVLRFGRPRHFITVGVRTGPTGTLYFGAAKGSPRPKLNRRANVIAWSDPHDVAAVKSALAQLH